MKRTAMRYKIGKIDIFTYGRGEIIYQRFLLSPKLFFFFFFMTFKFQEYRWNIVPICRHKILYYLPIVYTLFIERTRLNRHESRFFCESPRDTLSYVNRFRRKRDAGGRAESACIFRRTEYTHIFFPRLQLYL